MLEQSDIPLFLCNRLCLDVGFNFHFLQRNTHLEIWVCVLLKMQ